MALTIGQIVDNDSVGTKCRLSDGSFGIVAHGGATPSVGQEVAKGEFGYLIPVEGTRPHQTVKIELEVGGVTVVEESSDAVQLDGSAAKTEDPDKPEA